LRPRYALGFTMRLWSIPAPLVGFGRLGLCLCRGRHEGDERIADGLLHRVHRTVDDPPPPMRLLASCRASVAMLPRISRSIASFSAGVSPSHRGMPWGFLLGGEMPAARSPILNAPPTVAADALSGPDALHASPSSRRWPARSRPVNLPGRNGSPPPSSRSALASRGRG
jgi:hypothetical protein